MNNQKKRITFVLVAVLLFVISYFTVFESVCSVHDCMGQDCPICHELHSAGIYTKQLTVAAVYTAVAFLMAVCALKATAASTGSMSERNLVNDKVRIDS